MEKNMKIFEKAGMGKAQAEQKSAVECGYWHL
jgi:hypothetical protein